MHNSLTKPTSVEIAHSVSVTEKTKLTSKQKIVQFVVTDEDLEKRARLKNRVTVVSTKAETSNDVDDVSEEEGDEHAKYTCSFCERTFNDRSAHWRHTNSTKRACVSFAKMNEVYEDLKHKENKLKKQEKTIFKLSQQLEIITKVVQPKLTIHGDYINQNQIYNNNSKQMVSFQFSTPEKERIDHIPDDRMLAIINISDFDEVLVQLVDAVYFDPLAPQNFKWCINDLDAQYGALEYDNNSKQIATRKTSSVINNNVQHILDGVREVVEDLQKKHIFSVTQNRNTGKLCGLIGVELDIGQMKGIKQKAYAERDHIKSVWRKYDIRPVTVQK